MSELGLVCITHSDEVRYKTITRKRLLQFEHATQQKMLDDLYRENLQRLEKGLRYCKREGISLYRLPSSIFPFSDEPVGREVFDKLEGAVARTGEWATANDIRLVMHPDQFVVLSSDSENVVANSIKILEMHAHVMDLLRQPRSPWALLEIHGGKSDRAQALVDCIARLPDGIRLRLALENDEYAYSAQEIYDICMRSGVPMVFDAHHHVVHEKLDSYEHPSVKEMLEKARETWANPEHQLVHISNGRTDFNDRNHSDLIEDLPSSYEEAPWIEIEAKWKELAIQRLRDAHASHGRRRSA
ncbi:UV DNA damage repair endonuclease UvsE [Noviherbaspirillum galbum]|uniref:UV DNA damage repair endonuclease UvsE n=1 Tax=Noviherbaspirillum galbum TaxID=2709383 RepID=A0A6B3SQS0_9BURK|nr:UV DNA damage repair endonuclease UvsE [Noviherbaspirillum galbum]NEX60009.1 UV DNA damage repair endonuclease UvsE [Noviherbaspirillum galbum]